MERDKIISVRVNSELLDKVNKAIDSRTRKFYCYGSHSYIYTDLKGYIHNKFTMADLLEEAMKAYLKEFEKL